VRDRDIAVNSDKSASLNEKLTPRRDAAMTFDPFSESKASLQILN
jgi:hypothetical protein